MGKAFGGNHIPWSRSRFVGLGYLLKAADACPVYEQEQAIDRGEGGEIGECDQNIAGHQEKSPPAALLNASSDGIADGENINRGQVFAVLTRSGSTSGRLCDPSTAPTPLGGQGGRPSSLAAHVIASWPILEIVDFAVEGDPKSHVLLWSQV